MYAKQNILNSERRLHFHIIHSCFLAITTQILKALFPWGNTLHRKNRTFNFRMSQLYDETRQL